MMIRPARVHSPTRLPRWGAATFAWCSALVAFATHAEPATAQTVGGTVVDDVTGLSVYTAAVSLLVGQDSAVAYFETDRTGHFLFHVAPGRYRLRAARLGYVEFVTDTFTVAAGQDAVAELRLRLSPVALDPLEATVERPRPRRLERVGFYHRQDLGFGDFRTPEDLARLRPAFHDELFRGIPGVRIVGDTLVSLAFYRPCAIPVFVDGTRDSLWTETVSVHDVEAVEVYHRPGGVPPWARVSSCGAVLIWTKR